MRQKQPNPAAELLPTLNASVVPWTPILKSLSSSLRLTPVYREARFLAELQSSVVNCLLEVVRAGNLLAFRQAQNIGCVDPRGRHISVNTGLLQEVDGKVTSNLIEIGRRRIDTSHLTKTPRQVRLLFLRFLLLLFLVTLFGGALIAHILRFSSELLKLVDVRMSHDPAEELGLTKLRSRLALLFPLGTGLGRLTLRFLRFLCIL